MSKLKIVVNKKTTTSEIDYDFKNIDGLTYLNSINNNSIDLILTDPPYIISRDSGMNTHYNKVKDNEKNNIDLVKTEEEWEEYKIKNKVKKIESFFSFCKKIKIIK